MPMSDLKRLIESRAVSYERYNHLVKEAFNNGGSDYGRTVALLAIAEATMLSGRAAGADAEGSR
jgi:hypothetical protein